MFRKFIKIMLFIFGICFIIGGIASIFIVANGGTVSLPSSRPRISSTSNISEYSGSGGILISVFMTLLGVWMISSTRKKHTTEKPLKNEQQPSVPVSCIWLKADDGWHYEHNPIPKMDYPATNRCPLCGKEIQIIELYKNTKHFPYE